MDVTPSRWGYRLNGQQLIYQVGTPKRGDVIAFKPNGSSTGHSSIKRVIGLPGETIQIKDGMIYIDGEVYLEKRAIRSSQTQGMASDGITLGNREYFVLGDNRNNSVDSRFADVGTVKASYIEGKSMVCAFSVGASRAGQIMEVNYELSVVSRPYDEGEAHDAGGYPPH
ncbi:MAG: signal peptidase I [Lachnospiraceae bacterium]